jgi:hypothetical protein
MPFTGLGIVTVGGVIDAQSTVLLHLCHRASRPIRYAGYFVWAIHMEHLISCPDKSIEQTSRRTFMVV